jgi:hypothetical protein
MEVSLWSNIRCAAPTPRVVVSRIFRTFGWLSGTRPWLTR